jgi:hypothetical protein
MTDYREVDPPPPLDALPDDERRVMDAIIRTIAEDMPGPATMPIEERIAGIRGLYEKGYIRFVVDEVTDSYGYEMTLPKDVGVRSE